MEEIYIRLVKLHETSFVMYLKVDNEILVSRDTSVSGCLSGMMGKVAVKNVHMTQERLFKLIESFNSNDV